MIFNLRLLAALPLLGASALAFAQTPAETFRPDLFFAGSTRGSGQVTVLTASRPRALAVEGTGRIEADGTLVLDQAIRIDAKTSRRTFRLRRLPDGSWQGTMTDATGPVVATVAGPTLRLADPMKTRGMRMNQILTLQPSGRTVLNRAVVTMMGIRVARIDETIEKLDSTPQAIR